MAMLRTSIWDITSSRSQDAELPDSVAVTRLLVLLVERMNLPLNSPDGQVMSYQLHHKQSGKQLLDNQTLADNSYHVSYSQNPDCPWHDEPPAIESQFDFSHHTMFNEIWKFAESRLGGIDAIDLSREIVTGLNCSQCGLKRALFKPIDHSSQADAV